MRVAGELELSREEDSVMCLAAGARKGKASYLYAGINSSPDTIKKGTNHHLRIMTVEPSKAIKAAPSSPSATGAKITEVSRSSFFEHPDADMYQRLVRVAGGIGAAASALGKEPQLAVFETGGAKPKIRGVLELPAEAESIDVIQTGENEYQVAYCFKHELHIFNIGKQTNGEPELVFTMPNDHGIRPQFRFIRYLTPEFILAVANLPKRNTGALIQGLRLPAPGHERARLATTVRVPGNISASGLAVVNLSPPASPSASVGETQFIIAVAGTDASISLYTLKHQVSPTLNLLLNLYPLYTLKNVHGDDNISGLAFSPFTTPKTHVRAQFVKLASISLQKNVSVHSIPLQKHIDTQPRNKKGPPRPVRYEVAMRSHGPSARPIIIVLSLIVLFLAFITQAVREMYDMSPPVIFASGVLPAWHGSLRVPNHVPEHFYENKKFLKNLAATAGEKLSAPLAGEKLVLFDVEHPVVAATAPGEDGGETASTTPKLQVEVHDEDTHGEARSWDQLPIAEQIAWKERLREAGAWTQNMGENVFKGVLFGELAGAVGRAVGG